MNQDATLFPYFQSVTQAERSSIKTHQPAVIWFTGLSGSGKSTLANAVEAALNRVYKVHTYLLDGDNIRMGLNRGLGFSVEDRTENIRRIGEVSKLFVDAGLIALTAFISPLRQDRDQVRALISENRFFEIYAACPLQVCEERDTKGLYRKARAGLIPEFTGISAPYEEPLKPELILRTDQLPLQECVQRVIALLQTHSIINNH